jgi:hypothetical protein
MSTLNVTGTATNSAGLSSPFSGVITVTDPVLPPVIDSVTVSPASAPTGTMRTITITAHDPGGLALTYTCLVNGAAATPTSQPNVFTVVA